MKASFVLPLFLLPAMALANPAVKLEFSTSPLSVAQNTCAPVGIVVDNNLLKPAAVNAATRIVVDQQGNGGIKFFLDPLCRSAISASQPFVIAGGAAIGTFYVEGPALGSFTLRISAQGLESQLQTESFTLPQTGGGIQIAPASAPSQAANAGFSTLVFDDEFNSDTISPNGAGVFNWYTTNFYAPSATLPNSGYSVQNGYLTINTDESGYSDGLATADPSATSQVWQHGYFEASIRYNPKGHSTGAWPAFWSYSIEQALGQVPSGTPYGEIDFMECYPVGNSCDYITTVHQWLGGSSTAQNSNNAPTLPKATDFTQFHTYGCLWKPDQIQWYFDNQLVTTVSTGPGTNFTGVENDFMTVILGTGAAWPMDVDFVHVWH